MVSFVFKGVIIRKSPDRPNKYLAKKKGKRKESFAQTKNGKGNQKIEINQKKKKRLDQIQPEAWFNSVVGDSHRV